MQIICGFIIFQIIDPGDLVAIIVIPTLSLLIGWLAWVMTRTRHLQVKAQLELHKRFLDRLNDSQDLVELLKSGEGREFLIAIVGDRKILPIDILASIQKGTIFTMVGLGGLLARVVIPQGFGLFILASFIIGIIGIGLLISAAITYHLSRAWGLISTSEASVLRDRLRNKKIF